MSRGGGSNQIQQVPSTVRRDPWGPQQAPLERGFGRAEELYNQPEPQYFPGAGVVPFAPETEQALTQTTNRALQGNPLVPQAQQYASDVLGGGFLGGNQFFDDAFEAQVRPTVQQYTQQIAPGIDAQFNAANRMGSNSYATARNTADESFARALSDTAAKMAYGNYAQERGMQQSMASLAPGLASQDYEDLSRLAGVGGAREAQGQAQLQDEINRFNFEQQAPGNRLAQYMGNIQGSYGGTQQSSQPVFAGSPGTRFLGGALGGAGLARAFGGQDTDPWALGLGALGGGFLGM
jgi:hypothetical protein